MSIAIGRAFREAIMTGDLTPRQERNSKIFEMLPEGEREKMRYVYACRLANRLYLELSGTESIETRGEMTFVLSSFIRDEDCNWLDAKFRQYKGWVVCMAERIKKSHLYPEQKGIVARELWELVEEEMEEAKYIF